jgi:uncharacterized membrane protein
MDLILVISLMLLFAFSVGFWATDDAPYGTIIAFVAVLLITIFYFNMDRKTEVIETQTLVTSQGVELNGYFDDDNRFVIIGNNVTCVNKVHPLKWSIEPIKYEICK